MREEFVGAHWQGVDADARCIQQCIADGRWRRDHRWLPKGLVAIAGAGFEGLDKIMVQLRYIHKGWELIIKQIVVVNMATLWIDHHLFKQRGTYTHKSSTMDLTCGLNRIKDYP